MCVAAFIKSDDLKKAREVFALPSENGGARYRVRTEDDLPVVESEENRGPTWAEMRWSARQVWAGKSLASFNVKSERVGENQLWKVSYGTRHCLLFCSGFFERKGTDRPPRYHYFTRADRKTMALAGLWKFWENKKICTFLTQPADARVSSIHPRMPLFLGEECWKSWLDVVKFQDVDWKKVVSTSSCELDSWPVTSDLFRSNLRNDESVLKKINVPQQIELF